MYKWLHKTPFFMVKHNTNSADYKIMTEQLNAFIEGRYLFLDTTGVKKEIPFDSGIFLAFYQP